MRRLLPPLLILLTAAWLVGCSEDEKPPVSEVPLERDPCLDCHGDKDVLMAMLPEEVARVTTRGDG